MANTPFVPLQALRKRTTSDQKPRPKNSVPSKPVVAEDLNIDEQISVHPPVVDEVCLNKFCFWVNFFFVFQQSKKPRAKRQIAAKFDNSI